MPAVHTVGYTFILNDCLFYFALITNSHIQSSKNFFWKNTKTATAAKRPIATQINGGAV